MKTILKRSLAMLLCIGLLLSYAGCAASAVAEPERTTYDTEITYTVDYEAEPTATPAPAETHEASEPSALTPIDIAALPSAENPPLPEPDPDAEKTYYDAEASYSVEYELETPASVPEEPSGELDEIGSGYLFPSEEVFTPKESSEDDDSILSSLSGMTGEAQNAIGSSQPSAIHAAPKQLTIEDIQAMNPDTLVIDIYSDEGYLSTLVGKYYEGKVSNVEDGVLSIQGLAALLGLSKGCEFFAVYSEKNNTGYTFYTYQQRYGGYTIRYATLRIIVDPDGYTAGLSCSFVPNIGTASQEDAISAKEAEAVVANRFAKYDLVLYSERTVRLVVPFNGMVRNCWVVYTNNPLDDASFDMPYLEHFVATSGGYLMALPANTFAESNESVVDNSAYFEGMETTRYKTSVKLQDGTVRDVDVPVSFNPRDQKYYLMDPSRKIAVAQYGDFNYRNTVTFVTSDTVDGWSDNNLMAYANYIIVYDFYADHGIRSIDGFELPILITVGWCDEYGRAVNNACFYGILRGWACFGISDINHYGDSVDVIGHEYTHGVVAASTQAQYTVNETGAISEGYADIMGNIIEMSTDYTDDRTWQLGERTGELVRDMRDPNRKNQPGFVGDIHYMPPVLNPSDLNDYGGQHINNSLLNRIAYLMDQSGMTYEQQFSMWLTAIEIMHPYENYEDLHAALLLSLKINGMQQQYGSALNKAFAAVGLDQNWNVTYLSATREGYGRATVNLGSEIAQLSALVFFADAESGSIVTKGYPDRDGVVSVLLPVGAYIAQLMILDENTGSASYFNYGSKGWINNAEFKDFTVENGRIATLSVDTESEKLNLVRLDGGYFSMLVPEGWRYEINGEYASFSFKLFDQNDPSTQIFFYGGLAPFHKSEATRKFWKSYDRSGRIAAGPVLPVANIIGVLSTWDYCIAYQQYYDKQYFTTLSFDNIYSAYSFRGFFAELGSIDSGAYLSCSTPWDEDCRIAILCSLRDEDTMNLFNGNNFYTCRNMFAIVAPKDRYDKVFDQLLPILESLQFTNAYIQKSQSSDDPMVSQDVITERAKFLTGVLSEIYAMNKGN